MNIKTGPDAAEEIYAHDEKAKIIFITAMGDSTFFRTELKKRFPSKDYRILTKPVYKKDIEAVMEDFWFCPYYSPLFDQIFWYNLLSEDA